MKLAFLENCYDQRCDLMSNQIQDADATCTPANQKPKCYTACKTPQECRINEDGESCVYLTNQISRLSVL